MIDIKLVRENPDIIRENLKKRGDAEKQKMFEELIEMDKKWRNLTTDVQKLKTERNRISEEIIKLKKQGKDAEEEIRRSSELANEIKESEKKLDLYKEKIRFILMRLPNILHESVPIGKDDSENVEIKRWGTFPDNPKKDHLTILKNLGLIDQERANKVAGHGFYYLKKELVMLDYALQKYAIDFLMKKGFTLIEPPYMMRTEAYEGVTDLEEFETVQYKIEGENLRLISTSEHPIASMFMNETLLKEELPLKFIGISPCFRKEVGSHGKYTKGLFRMHQFNKVEQFIFSLPEDSWKFHEELQENCEEIFRSLKIPYRVVNVCTGDIGIVAAKKYDTEFLMADGNYREIGSNSNCTDYQARRLNIKYREKEGAPPSGFVHTLNSTAIATSRVMIAIIENYQQEDGSVLIPEVLRPYMNGLKKIG